MIEVGGTTTRAVVMEPMAGVAYRIHHDRRIVLGLQRAVECTGEIGAGLQQLVTETVRRLRAECLRAGAVRTVTVIDACVAEADDLADLVAVLRRGHDDPVQVRSRLDEVRLTLRAERALLGTGESLAVAHVGERVTRLVCHTHAEIRVTELPGPMRSEGPGIDLDQSRHELAAALANVQPLEPDACTPIATGAVATAVGRVIAPHPGGRRAARRTQIRVDELVALEHELLALMPAHLLRPALASGFDDRVMLGAIYLRLLAGRWGVDRLRVGDSSAIEGHLLELIAQEELPAAGADHTRPCRLATQ